MKPTTDDKVLFRSLCITSSSAKISPRKRKKANEVRRAYCGSNSELFAVMNFPLSFTSTIAPPPPPSCALICPPGDESTLDPCPDSGDVARVGAREPRTSSTEVSRQHTMLEHNVRTNSGTGVQAICIPLSPVQAYMRPKKSTAAVEVLTAVGFPWPQDPLIGSHFKRDFTRGR